MVIFLGTVNPTIFFLVEISWEYENFLSAAALSTDKGALKNVTLRVNPLTKLAATKDALLGPQNCGDGSGCAEGTFWFRVVDKAEYQKLQSDVFLREEKEMLQRNFLE